MLSLPIRSPRAGFILIEALIALSVLAAGTLALVRLHSAALSSSGDNASRAEALRIAHRQIEALRLDAHAPATPDTTPATPPDGTFNGHHTEYALSWQAAAPDPAPQSGASPVSIPVALNIDWIDRGGHNRSLQIHTQTTAQLPAHITASALPPDHPGQTPPPHPGGQAGRPTSKPAMLDNLDSDSNDNGDGTRILRNPPGHQDHTLLVRDTPNDAGGYDILLIIPTPPDTAAASDHNDTPHPFARITGLMHFDRHALDHGQGPLNATDNSLAQYTEIRASSGGWCRATPQDSQALTVPQPDNTPGLAIPYTCYLAPGWHGNIGIVFTPPYRADVCVGHPGASDNGSTTSPHPQPSPLRTYRGYRQTGIDRSALASTGMAPGSHYGNTNPAHPQQRITQDFLITRLNGNADCAQRMTDAEILSPNAGRHVCIIPDDRDDEEDVCPDVWPMATGSS